MLAKITRQVLESYFACKFKAHLKLLDVQGVASDHLNMIREDNRRFRTAAKQGLKNAHGDRIVPTQVNLTKSLLSVGSPLILEGTFEDEHLHLQFDGIMKMDGESAIGAFHYAPILFHDGRTVRQPQKQLLEIYATVLHALQGRTPRAGIIHHKGGIAAKVRLSPDAMVTQSVLRELRDIREGVTRC